MNFTVANHNNQKESKGFIHYDDVDFIDIPQMVTSGFAYAGGKFKDGHRKDVNYEGYEDVLILDIDEKVSIDQAKIIFKKYTNYIITSRSHQKLKNKVICDRYRVFIKLSETITSEEDRVEFINNIFSIFPFVDKSCRNSSRFYFSSPEDAEIYYNEGRELPIIKTKLSTSLSESKTNDTPSQTIPKGIYAFKDGLGVWVNSDGEILEGESSLEHNLKGARVYMDEEFYSGNRNNALFNTACMLLGDGIDDDDIIEFMTEENDSRDGVSFNELMQCIRSAKKLYT